MTDCLELLESYKIRIFLYLGTGKNRQSAEQKMIYNNINNK